MLKSGAFSKIYDATFKIYKIPTVTKDINPTNLYLKRLSLKNKKISQKNFYRINIKNLKQDRITLKANLLT